MLKPVFTTEAPKPGGHYSQAIIHGHTIYVAGQLPINPETGEKILGSIEEQTWQTLRNVAAIVRGAGSDTSRIIKTTVFISDIALWGRVNQVYAEFFGEHHPARSVVPVKELHYGFLIEIEAIAAIDE
jgi:2-iminobutanoate/2-iminopropanoate deaminase